MSVFQACGRIAVALVVCGGIAACSDDPAVSFTTVNNNPGSYDADFNGEGGSTSRSFEWENSGTRAEYAADTTASTAGRMDVAIYDADGNLVASFFLDASSPDDTVDGISSSGVAGTWTIEITLQDFEGDGTVSIGTAAD